MPGSDTRPEDLKGYSDQVKIRHATGADIQALAFLLAEAFRDDPYHTWIFPNSSVRTKRQRRFFTLSLQRRIGREAIFTTTDLQGVAAWAGPETPRSSILDTLRFKLLFGLNIGLRAPFLLPGVRRVLSRQPNYPHWYLSGVRKSLVLRKFFFPCRDVFLFRPWDFRQDCSVLLAPFVPAILRHPLLH